MKRPAPLSIPPAIASEVRAAARARGWDADAFLAHLVRIGMRIMEGMRAGIGAKGR